MKFIIKIGVTVSAVLIAYPYFDDPIVAICYGATWGAFCGWHIWPTIDAL